MPQKDAACRDALAGNCGRNGAPQIRCVSAVHYESRAIYFLTARGKEMARQLMADGRVQTLVHTRFNEMIRMSGVATPALDSEQVYWRDVIYAEQPYLANVYPGDTRDINIIFKVENIVLDYFNLGVRPIERAVFTLDEDMASALLRVFVLIPMRVSVAVPVLSTVRRSASSRVTRIA